MLNYIPLFSLLLLPHLLLLILPCSPPQCSCFTYPSCLACSPSTYFDPSTSTCHTCPSTLRGCLTCSTPTLCTSCSLNYTLNPSTSLCQCPTNYTEDPTGCYICNETIKDCQVCTNRTYCQKCIAGYEFDEGLGGCYVRCEIVGCLECAEGKMIADKSGCLICDEQNNFEMQDDDSCSCKQHHILNESHSSCLLCSSLLPNCSQCSLSPTPTCTSCLPGFYPTPSSHCSPCPLGCLTCSSPTTCTACSPSLHFTLSPTTPPSCICTPGYFLHPSLSLCIISCTPDSPCSCPYDHFLNLTNECQLCSSALPGCSSCQSSTNCTECSYSDHFTHDPIHTNRCSCLPNYSFDPHTNTCSPCSLQNPCSTCPSNNYYNPPTGECLYCGLALFGCQLCTNSSVCLRCEDPESLTIDRETQQCICKQGFVLYNVTEYFVFCQSCDRVAYMCKYCESLERCSVCEEGWALDGSGGCLNCEDRMVGCVDCVNYDICTVCSKERGFQLNGVACTCGLFQYMTNVTNTSTCLPCTNWGEECETCDNEGCIECIEGWKVGEGGKCEKECKIPLCLKCRDEEECGLCEPYAEMGGDRKGCGCVEGYYQVGEGGGCRGCRESMEGCIMCRNAGICLECEKGWMLMVGNTTVRCVLGEMRGWGWVVLGLIVGLGL